MDIRPGTAIATFDANGRYHGHAAIYVGQDARGIQVIDQWNIKNEAKEIIGQNTPSGRTLRFNEPGSAPVDRGENFYVVE